MLYFEGMLLGSQLTTASPAPCVKPTEAGCARTAWGHIVSPRAFSLYLFAMERDTVSIHFVQCALAQLTAAQREAALAQAGIAPALLQSAHARVTAQGFSALWLASATLLDDEFFGLDARRMKVGSFALLTQASMGADTLGHALQRLLRGFAVLLDQIHASLHAHGAVSEIRLHNRLQPLATRRFAEETLLILLHGLASWLIGQRLPIVCAEFEHPEPPHATEYRHMFSETLCFNAPHTRLCFDTAWLQAPLVQPPAQLKGFLRSAPQSVFVKYRNDHSSTSRIKRLLRACVGQPEWPDMRAVATQFGISVATLRRQLLAEHHSFQRIKDEVRRDAAIHQLCESRLSVSDIGAQLGFQEVSAFRRAFKSWSGVQPSEYRHRAKAAAQSNTSPTSDTTSRWTPNPA